MARDESGAVLPGVTVEVASPALIEKVRAAITDATGQYRVVSLSPGIYTVTFSLPGFSSVKHEGIELSGTFTATVNGDMKVGALEETITVSGNSPLVDVQSVATQTVITRAVIDALPAARNIQAAAVMIPGVTTSGVVGQSGRDVGGSTKLQQPSIVFRGNPNNIQRWDGFHLGNLAGANTGAGTSFYINDAIAQELSYSSGADSAEMGNPGLYIDLVPKDGGNRFSGTTFFDYTHEPWAWSNYSDRLKARGINDVTRVFEISDLNGGFGGPIRPRQAVVLRRAPLRNAGCERRRQLLRQESRSISLRAGSRSPGPRQRPYPERVAPAHMARDVEGQGPVLVHQPEQGARVLQHQRDRDARRRRPAGHQVRRSRLR